MSSAKFSQNVYFENIQEVILNEIRNATKSIQIAVAYFTDIDLFNALLQALDKNVNVDLLLPTNEININNNKIYYKYKEFIEKKGNLYLSNENIHHKFCILDDKTLLHGSYNWTFLAATCNKEDLSIRMEEDVIASFQNQFNKLKENIPKATISGYYPSTKITDRVPTGFRDLDKVIFGWGKSELIIIASQTSMGKSAFILSALRNAAVMFQKPVAIFTLETSSEQLIDRLISAEAEIESSRLKTRNLSDNERLNIVNKTTILNEQLIFINDSSISLSKLKDECRLLKVQKNVECIAIDYLQLITVSDNIDIEQKISLITRELKTLARVLDMPIILLSQLSSNMDKRGGNKKPQLRDLPESGSIENDADLVLFIYRPEYYNILHDESGNSTIGIMEVIIAKNRSGRLDTVKLKFIDKYTKVTNLDEEYTFEASYSANGFTLTNDEEVPF